LGGRRGWLQELLQASPGVCFADAIEIAALDVRQERRRLAGLDEDRQHEARPILGGSPLSGPAFPA